MPPGNIYFVVYFLNIFIFKLDYKGIIRLSSKLRFRWDILIILLALYNSITIPINIAFDPESLNSVGIAIFESFIDLIFFIDIMINFRTSYISTKTGDEIKDPYLIAKRYIINGRLILDILSSIPFDKLSRNGNDVLPMLGMLKLIRVGRVSVVIRNLNAKSDAKSCYKFMWSVFSLVLYIHVIGCLWFYIVASDEVWVPQKD